MLHTEPSDLTLLWCCFVCPIIDARRWYLLNLVCNTHNFSRFITDRLSECAVTKTEGSALPVRNPVIGRAPSSISVSQKTHFNKLYIAHLSCSWTQSGLAWQKHSGTVQDLPLDFIRRDLDSENFIESCSIIIWTQLIYINLILISLLILN